MNRTIHNLRAYADTDLVDGPARDTVLNILTMVEEDLGDTDEATTNDLIISYLFDDGGCDDQDAIDFFAARGIK